MRRLSLPISYSNFSTNYQYLREISVILLTCIVKDYDQIETQLPAKTRNEFIHESLCTFCDFTILQECRYFLETVRLPFLKTRAKKKNHTVIFCWSLPYFSWPKRHLNSLYWKTKISWELLKNQDYCCTYSRFIVYVRRPHKFHWLLCASQPK